MVAVLAEEIAQLKEENKMTRAENEGIMRERADNDTQKVENEGTGQEIKKLPHRLKIHESWNRPLPLLMATEFTKNRRKFRRNCERRS